MSHLTLRGLSEDEESLVLVDPTGAEHRLPVDDAVISAVRRARGAVASDAAPGEPLRPRDIQTMIRQGLSAVEVAADTGLDLEHIRRYEGPVLAERAHTAQQARRVVVYPDSDAGAAAPLGELVQTRLELREVDPETMEWDAWKRQDGTWCVSLTFIASGRQRTATWTFSHGSVVAQDDEARWLSDAGPTDSGPIPDYGSGEERRRRATAPAPAAPLEASRPGPARDHQTETGRILESLRRRRGIAPSAADPAASGPTDPTGPLSPTSPTGPTGPAPAAPAPTAPAPSSGGSLRLVGDEDDRTIDGAHAAPSRPADAQDSRIVALPAADDAGAQSPEDRHPDQHTEPIGTPRFDVPAPPHTAGTPAAEAGETPADSAPLAEEEAEPAGPGADHPSLLDDPALGGWSGEQATAGTSDDADEDRPEAAPAAGRSADDEAEPRRKRGRASVPSWDEIMFGGRGRD